MWLPVQEAPPSTGTGRRAEDAGRLSLARAFRSAAASPRSRLLRCSRSRAARLQGRSGSTLHDASMMVNCHGTSSLQDRSLLRTKISEESKFTAIGHRGTMVGIRARGAACRASTELAALPAVKREPVLIEIEQRRRPKLVTDSPRDCCDIRQRGAVSQQLVSKRL